MDTSSINRIDLLPASAASVTAVSVPVSGKTAGKDTAQSIVAAKSESATRTPSKTELKTSVDEINRLLKDTSEVHFSVDKDSGQYVVKVIDNETKEVLRQLPSEESLAISKNLNRTLKGLLIDSKA